MFFTNRQMTGRPMIDRLINKRDQTFSEIIELNEEIEILQGVIHSKRQRLQKMSVTIIERQQQMQHIRVASSQPKWKALEQSFGRNSPEMQTLKCLDGGRSL